MPLKPSLEDNQNCFVCGPSNPLGFKLRFEHPEKGLLRAKVQFKPDHQGYKGIVHGGLVTTILDEMMVNLAWVEKTPVVTAEITARLLKPVPVGETLFFEGRLIKGGSRVLYMKAEARNSHKILLAEATASCIRIRQGVD